MTIILYSLAILLAVALVGAPLLYFVSKRFAVESDPKVDEIAMLLPGANCGGCGFRGCRDFAENCAAATSLSGIYCPVGGAEMMQRVASIVGLVADSDVAAPVARLRCNGACGARPAVATYDGVSSCAVMASVAVGDRSCSFGCLGRGDCVSVCEFGALSVSPQTGLPVVDEARCTACGKCVGKCPRNLLEIVPRGRRDRRVWVACSNRDRGPVARKTCAAACIGCGKCVRTCPFGAITLNDNLATIDPAVCRACGKCVPGCPTGAILSTFKIPANEEGNV